jgi:virginiamycin B lyase
MTRFRLLVVALAPAALAAACGGGQHRTTPRAATDRGAAIAEINIEQAGAERLRITGDWLAAGVGGIWLSGRRAIYRLDPTSGRRRASIAVRQEPCEATDVGFGSVWTATCGIRGLARIDPATNRVSRRIKLPIPQELDGEGSIGAGARGVWLVIDGPRCTACRVARVHPRAMRVTAGVPVEDGAAGVRVGGGSVWVTNPRRNLVQQIDPHSLKVVRTVNAGAGPRFLDVGEGAAWALDQVDGAVTRIDAATGKTLRVEAGVEGEGGDLTVGGGSVWARGSSDLLTRIDPRDNRVIARYGPESGSGAVIVGSGAVWISAHDIHVVWRLPLPHK